MTQPSVRLSSAIVTIIVGMSFLACGSDGTSAPPADGILRVGMWGGDSAGVIVADTLVHVHVGCTFGDIPQHVSLDAAGRFEATGSYLLRAFPVAVGPTMPAHFSGQVSGSTLSIVVTVTDTIEHTVVVRGPAVVTFGKDANLGPCPICVKPGERGPVPMPAVPARRSWWRLW